MALIDKYIATGTFDGSQSGDSEGSAYLASNAAEFDHIMREVLNAEGYHIHIAAGTYFTNGLRYTYGGTDFGWYVRSNWTITGAGEGSTFIKLYSWPPSSIVTSGSKWSVVGSSDAVSNVIIENLTVDGNWTSLLSPPSDWPDNAATALHCVACVTNGPITHQNLTITGFYGNALSGTECFALCCHADKTPIDPTENIASQLAVFDQCTVHGGDGDYCVGIASFNGGPSIINGCNIYSLANLHSGAIQVIGKDIQITNNIVRDCFYPFYVDTGNIINLLMEGNQFISNGPAPILTNSTSRKVYINIREADMDGSFDGVYMDVPIRPVGETSPYYRIRLYYHLDGSTNIPDYPRDPNGDVSGILIACPFEENATIDQLEGAYNGAMTPPYDGAIVAGLNAALGTEGTEGRFVKYTRADGAEYGVAILYPATDDSQWIYHSAGVPFVSDELKVYIQSGWSWTNWKIRNNYLEVAFEPSGTYSQQYLIKLDGNGNSDQDYHISDNVARFTGSYHGIPTAGLQMTGIENVKVLNNALDTDPINYGGTLIAQAETNDGEPVPIDILYKFGNKDLSELPHPSLADDLHLWASIGSGESYVNGKALVPKLGLGTSPLTGSHLSNEADAVDGAQQVSPAIRWTGAGWKTDTTPTAAGSQPVSFRAYVAPAQGTANPTGSWVLESSINGGEYSTVLSCDADGAMSVANLNAQFGIFSNYVQFLDGLTTSLAYRIGDNSVSWTEGTAAPTAEEPDGSIYTRSGSGPTTGFYVRMDGGWVRIDPHSPGPIGDASPGTGAFTALSALGITVEGGVSAASFSGSGASLTGLTKSQVGLSNVDNTSDTTKNAATATLTNKTISGSSNTLTNIDGGAITGNIAIARIATALSSPGAIGGSTPGAGTFTTLTATNTVALSPSGANVTISPSGTGNVTISPSGSGTLTVNPATAGSINNVNVGATTAGTGRFTTLTATSTVTLSPSNAMVTISPTGSGGSVTISPGNGVTISPTGGAVTISPSSSGVTIAPTGGNAVTITPTGALTLGATGSSATILAPGNNIVEQRNSTNAQAFRVYRTY